MSDLLYEGLNSEVNPLLSESISRAEGISILASAFKEGYDDATTIPTDRIATLEAEARYGDDKALKQWFINGVNYAHEGWGVDEAVQDYMEYVESFG